mgnify:CR=1 FL=1
MEKEIKQELSALRRLGNVLFWIMGLVILVGSFAAGFFIYSDEYDYTLLTCNKPNKEGYPSFEEKQFKVYRYISTYSDAPDAEYWKQCLYIVESESDILKIVNNDSDITGSGKYEKSVNIPMSLAVDYLIYHNIKLLPILSSNKDSANAIFWQRLQYTQHPPLNYTALDNQYDLWKAVIAGLLACVLGLIFIGLLYKTMVYIVDGKPFFKLK